MSENQNGKSNNGNNVLYLLMGALLALGGYYGIQAISDDEPEPPTAEVAIVHFGPIWYKHSIFQKINAAPDNDPNLARYAEELLEADFLHYNFADDLSNNTAVINGTERVVVGEGWVYCDCDAYGQNEEISQEILENERGRCHYDDFFTKTKVVVPEGTIASFSYLETGEDYQNISPASFDPDTLTLGESTYTLINIIWDRNQIKSGLGRISFQDGQNDKRYDMTVFLNKENNKFYY